MLAVTRTYESFEQSKTGVFGIYADRVIGRDRNHSDSGEFAYALPDARDKRGEEHELRQ